MAEYVIIMAGSLGGGTHRTWTEDKPLIRQERGADMRKAGTRTATAAGRYNRRDGLSPASFVLMELLIVIAIIALLMAILLPTLNRIARAAKAVACQANLHQWGLMFSMYTAANDGKFFAIGSGDTWIGPMQPYYAKCENSLFLCPVAKKPYVWQLTGIGQQRLVHSSEG